MTECCNDYPPLSVVRSSLLGGWEENAQWSLYRVPQSSMLLLLLFNIHMRLLGKVFYWLQISMQFYILTVSWPDFVKVFFLCVGGCIVSGWGGTHSSSALTRPNGCGYLDTQFWDTWAIWCSFWTYNFYSRASGSCSKEGFRHSFSVLIVL